MKQTTHSDQIIIQYLLNDLAAEEEARFEEAYLRDGSLFEQVQALEEELIEDYVKGNLSDYERKRFERHYLVSAPRRARVETARQLVNLCSSPPPAPIAVGIRSFSSRLLWLMQQPLAPGFGVATALLLVLGAVLAIEELRLRGWLTAVSEERAALARRTEEAEQQLAYERGLLSEERTQSIALRERLGDVENQLDRLKQERPQLRTSIGQVVFLALAPGSRDIKKQDVAVMSSRTKFVELRVGIERQEPRDLRSYRVVLQTVEEGKVIWTREGISPRQSGSFQYVVVRVPADNFRAVGEQDFMLTLSARAAGDNSYEDIEGYYFQVTSKN